MKRLLTLVAMMTMLLLPASPLALADHGSGSDGARADNNTTTSNTGTHGDSTELPHLKGLADNEINRRLGSLHSLENIVQDAHCLSAADKAKIEAEIRTEQSALPAVKTKIDDDGDTTTEREHVKSVSDDFKNFALIMPKVHLLRVSDRLTCAVTKVTKYADRLQTNIDAAKTAGKDVTSETTTMTDMRAQLKAASDDLSSALNAILNTTPDQFKADPSIVTNIKNQLNAGRQAIIQALKDGNTIRDGLKSLGAI